MMNYCIMNEHHEILSFFHISRILEENYETKNILTYFYNNVNKNLKFIDRQYKNLTIGPDLI